jgi:hypothetical protein
MTAELMELPGLFDRKGRNIEADLSTLLAYLRGRGWRTAKEIAAHPELGFSDRYTRAIAQHSKGQIISGDLGYKYNFDATREEKDEFRQRLISQAKNMIKRAIDADRVWHSGRAA